MTSRLPDPRWGQISFLLCFLAVGVWQRDFALQGLQILGALLASVLTQFLCLAAKDLPRDRLHHYLSALITPLGLSILVRADNLWVHPLVAALACASKFWLRAGPSARSSHVFNPANLGAFVAWAVLPGAWLSPGQWGSDALLALWFLALGGCITGWVGRLDISLAFLGSWACLLAARLLWLETEPALAWATWAQQMASGSTLLFAFFMISDPMTTPQERGARIGFAVMVAVLAFAWQFVLYRPHGLIVVLAALSPLVPLLNHLRHGTKPQWQGSECDGVRGPMLRPGKY